MLQTEKLLNLEKFLSEQNGKIAVYGLKLNARDVNCFFHESIACFLDREMKSGTFCGLPIVGLEDLPQYNIHAIVIAASLSAEPYIYARIHEFCGTNGIVIYGLHSGKLKSGRLGKDLSVKVATREALREAIVSHDVISFDIFDTLLMRKVLYPTDVFDIVENRLRKQGIDVPGFKNYRIQAERGDRSHKDLSAIYSTLKAMLGWSEKHMNLAMKEELAVEKQAILPRPGMMEIFSYAHAMGKQVLLVSDMYLPAEFLQEILSKHGFAHYDELYISANRGAGKGGQLFELVRAEHPAKSYLHIGDNAILDGGAARIRGFDTWLLDSGLQKLRDSEVDTILPFVENFNDRLLLGLFVVKAYGNPFEQACVNNVQKFASLFLTPLAAQYVLWLLQRAMDHHFEAILFAARDGWLFRRLYQEATKVIDLKNIPPGIYFYASRKLCISAALQDEKSLEWMRGILAEQTHYFLRNVFGFVPKDGHEPPVQGENPDLIWDEVLEIKESIFDSSAAIRQGYERYITKQGLRREGRYAFIDLNSQGSSQCALTHSILPHIYGLIFARFISSSSVTMGRIETFLPQADCSHMFANNAAEFIFSSPEPSAASVNADGEIVFEEEDRSISELKILQEAQESIINFCHDFFSLCDITSAVNPAVGQFLLSMYQKPPFVGASSVFDGMDIKDDLKGIRLECLLTNER